MSGHSKWNNIKNRKGAQDNKKGKVFSLMSKHIRMAVKEGKSGVIEDNPALRLAVEKARSVNMPKENISRAIDRGLGKTAAGSVIQEIVYEGFGPQGVGMLVVAMTDNNQRTSGSIRAAFSRAGGSLAGPGSVMYMFERLGEEYSCTMPMPITDGQLIEQLEELIDTLRDNEDVEDVFCAGVWESQEDSNG